MAKSDEQATFGIVLEDEASESAEKMSESVEQLRKRLADGQAAVKGMSAALRNLRGTSEAVKSAKEQLKAKIAAEKDKLSEAQIAILRNREATGKLAAAKSLLGRVVGVLGGGIKRLTGDTKASELGLSLLKGAALGLVGAVVALTAAAAASVVGLAAFVIHGANAARSANLLREAAAGSAANATALGSQVDALARKVPTGKAALNELAVSLAKGGVQGQTLVDTLNAVGQASAAMGDDAGNKLREIVDRGRLTQRVGIGFDELQGTGLQRDDVAASLSKNLKVSIAEARAALAEGRVKLADGAKAIRDAVEAKFGGLNLRKMLDLNVIGAKLKERFDSLTENVQLEPLLKAFESIAEIFDDTTVSGSALKELVTVFGNTLVKDFTKGGPLVKTFFKGLVIGALQAGIMFLKLRNWLRDTFANSETLRGLVTFETALNAGKTVAGVLLVGFAALAATIGAAVAAIALVGTVLQTLMDAGVKFGEWIRTVDWGQLGGSIVDGILGGIKNGGKRLLSGAKELAETVKSGFKDTLGIRSPSKVFEGYGAHTVEGFAQGVESKTPDAARALDSMATKPSSAAGGGSKGSGPISVSIPISISVSGGDGAGTAKALSDPSFLQQLTKAVEEALVSAGLPVRV